MRLISLTVAVILAAAPLQAQQRLPSSRGAGSSAVEDGARFDLPVSVERIREALERAPEKSLLDGYDIEPDYRVEIE